MVLPARSRLSLQIGADVEGLHDLFDRYGHLIGHRYGDLDLDDERRVGGFSNISLPEACATVFDNGLSTFELSASSGGHDLAIIAIASAGADLVYEQRGSVVTAAPGEAVVYSSAERLRSHSGAVGRLIAVALPAAKLRPLVHGDALGRIGKLPADDAALRLFRAHAEAWLALDDPPGSPLSELISDQLCDLAALAIGTSRRGRDKIAASGQDEGGALADARFRRATSFIRRNLHRDGLADRHVAADLGISPSLLRTIFAARGTSPARYIRRLRLDRAYHRLATRADGRASTIVEIALECGFGSLSSFYRLFRETYGIAPGEVREARDATPH